MTEYTVAREIRAPAATLWAILKDPTALASPDFGILALTGDIAPGKQIKLRSEVDPKRVFSLRVSEFDPERKMVWSGGMPLGLFRGERAFQLTPTSDGTRFTMTERFSGALAGMITRSMPDLQPSFEKFGDALKERAEA